MTGSTSHTGDTHVPDAMAEQPPSGPWAATGPDDPWWSPAPDRERATEAGSPTEPEPAIAPELATDPDARESEDGAALAVVRGDDADLEWASRDDDADVSPVPDNHAEPIDNHGEPFDVVPVPLPANPQTRPAAPDDEHAAAVLAGQFSWRPPSHERYAAQDEREAVNTEPPAVPAPAHAVDDEPFWMPTEEVARGDADTAWPAPRMRAGRRTGSLHRSESATTRTAPPRSPRRTGPALTALVALSLLAAFFGWVSAEPFWLAVGHGSTGTATVDRCTGSGVAQRCVGRFAEADGRFAVDRVTLLGITDGERHAGAAVRARMVGSGSDRAYVRTDGLGLHLRWGLGLALVLLCGAGIAWATGATRLEDPLARRRAVLASLAGPLLLALGFIAAAW